MAQVLEIRMMGVQPKPCSPVLSEDSGTGNHASRSGVREGDLGRSQTPWGEDDHVYEIPLLIKEEFFKETTQQLSVELTVSADEVALRYSALEARNRSQAKV